MSYQSVSVLTCTPSTEPAGSICPAGYALTTQTVMVPTTDPDVIDTTAIDIGVISFALVVTTYVIAHGLGLLFRVFREA